VTRSRRWWAAALAGGLLALVAAVPAGALPAAARSTPAAAAAAAAPGVAQHPEYWFPQWGIPQIWAGGATGQGVTVAVIDTGVQASVNDLSGSVVSGTDLTGLGGNGHTDRDRNRFDHGTAMAGLIAGHGGRYLAGVAPSSKILPVAVPLVGTNQGEHSPDYIADAVRYAAMHGAKVISMSLGGLRYPDEDQMACPADTQDAIFYALSKGAIVVAAGGNSGLKDNPTEEPGVCLGVIAVAAVDARRRAPEFSSRHAYLTVAAPGVDIPTINAADAIFIGNGTSQSTALTSGALALIWSAHPNETNRQITARLIAGVRDAGPRGVDSTFGYGTINPAASISVRLGPNTPNPVFTRADPFLTTRGPAVAAALPKPPAAKVRPPAAFVTAAPAEVGISRTLWLGVAAGASGALVLLALLLTRRRRGSAPVWPPPPPGLPPPGPPPPGFPPPEYATPG
jgi:subtilisin family serine protease